MVRIRPKVAISSPSHWPSAGARLHRQLQHRQVEHQMRGPGAEDAEGELGERCRLRHRRQRQLAARGRDQADRRVHVRAGDRAEHGDEDEQDRAGRERVAEQGDRVIPADRFAAMIPEPITQANRKKEPRPSAASRRASGGESAKRRLRIFGASRCRCSRCCKLSSSMLSSGKARNRPMPPLQREESRVEGTIPASPSAAAGSSIPQWAVISWPGQIGQTSPAALSQTVKTKSSFGRAILREFLPAFRAVAFGRRNPSHRVFQAPAGGPRLWGSCPRKKPGSGPRLRG